MGEDEALIFDAHLMVLEDNALITETIQHIEQNKQNVEYSFNVVVERYINFFKTIEDEYLRERVSDIKDVSRRVLNHLVGATKNTSLSTPQNRIIVSEDITPSQAVSFNKDNLLGFITDYTIMEEVSIKNTEGNLIYFGMDLTKLNGNNNMKEFIEYMCVQQLGFQQ